MVGMVHDALEEEQHFKPQLGSKDPYNKAVEKRIEEEIKLTKENSYSKI
ncbi:hypothetical protein GBAR_LOCUS20399, partial [Geodia barretti]